MKEKVSELHYWNQIDWFKANAHWYLSYQNFEMTGRIPKFFRFYFPYFYFFGLVVFVILEDTDYNFYKVNSDQWLVGHWNQSFGCALYQTNSNDFTFAFGFYHPQEKFIGCL